MRLSELAGEQFSNDPEISGLTADSRSVEQGYLFAALPGVAADGAKFIPQAEERGASAVLARPGATSRLPVVADEQPRRRLSEMAARFFPRQPEFIAGITGTNGKTSTAFFVSQLWRMAGRNGGSLGTLGASGKSFHRPLIHTTPEPVTLHKVLDDMAAAGIDRLAMEVSSHGLAQHRADGVHYNVAAFTNLSQDHLDYHDTFVDYRDAKLRLFTSLLGDNGIAIINIDDPAAKYFVDAVKPQNKRALTLGANDADVMIKSVTPHPGGLALQITTPYKNCEAVSLDLPLVGAFQAENALLAALIVIESGENPQDVFAQLEKLAPVPGRMELAATVAGASIYVDYAHTPDAVETALTNLRPHVGARLIAIIGAGGDRDQSKRKLMGAAARQNADVVIVTDDNPRTEDPAKIRRAVLEGAKGAHEIGDRGEAIAAGVAMLKDGDVLLIAGKGHETGQVVGDQTLPFNDVEAAKAAASQRRNNIGSET